MSDPTILKETVEVAKAMGPIGAFGLNAKIFTAQLINFGVVLIVLWRFAYRPIVTMLEERSEKIEKSVKHAEEIETRVKATEEEREVLLRQARLDAQEIATNAEATMEARKKEAIDKAREEVAKVVVQGKAQIASEREEMLTTLRKEMAEVAILAAEKVLKANVDKTTSQKLAQETLKEAGF